MAPSTELTRIRDRAAEFPTGPFLLTVDAGHHPHCSPTEVSWCDETVAVPAPSKWASIQACGHEWVSLLWPPPQPGGYSLIVDGVAEQEPGDAGPRLSITPTRAVLHRRGVPAGDGGSSCGSDCVPIFPG